MVWRQVAVRWRCLVEPVGRLWAGPQMGWAVRLRLAARGVGPSVASWVARGAGRLAVSRSVVSL